MSIFIPVSLCLLLLLIQLLRFLHRLWWTPLRMEKVLKSQGIKGAPYHFLHGSNKEIVAMTQKATSRPMELSDHDVFPRMQPHIHTWIKQYGKCFLNWYGTRAQLVVTDLDMIKDILNDKGGAYPKVDVPGLARKLLGDGLVAAKGEKWAKLRKLSNHAFYSENLKNMHPAMVASVEAMLESWSNKDGKEVEVYEEFRTLSSEVIARTAFGSSFEEGKNTFDMLKELCVVIQRNAFRVRLPLIGEFTKSQDDIESDRLLSGIRDSIIRIIKKRERNVKKGDYGNDFLGALLRAKDEPDEKKRFSMDEIIDECKTLYNSGQDTTTSLLSWTALLLAIHTEWQEKARKEVIELFGQETPTPQGIARLKIITMVINESLRLYSPVLNIARTVKKEVKVGNLTLPADLDLLITPLALHHSPEIWGEDVHLFKPERFAEGVAKAANGNSMAFLPFGYGPRFCVGMNFATIEAKIALAMILQRYKFTLSPNYVHSPIKVLTVRPQHGIQLILQKL